jgi:hypothetical protein
LNINILQKDNDLIVINENNSSILCLDELNKLLDFFCFLLRNWESIDLIRKTNYFYSNNLNLFFLKSAIDPQNQYNDLFCEIGLFDDITISCFFLKKESCFLSIEMEFNLQDIVNIIFWIKQILLKCEENE